MMTEHIDQEPIDVVADVAVPPFPSLEAVRFMHGELLKRQRETNNSPRFQEEVTEFVRRVQVTGSLLHTDKERSTAQTLIDYWVTALYRATRREQGEVVLLDFDLEVAAGRELSDDEYPYFDMADASEADTGLLLGMKRLVADACRRIDEHRMAAIVGPSGSGKSSLLREVVDALHGGAAFNSANWRHYPPMIPGEDPLRQLAELFRPADADEAQWAEEHVQRFRDDDAHLSRLVEQSGDEPVLLIVDGFEEIFRSCHDHHERDALVNNLVQMLETPNAMGSLLLVMDSDFLAQVDELDRLHPHFQRSLVYVSYSADELREAIERPAKLIGLHFDEGIIDRLILDVQADPASLTLLHFTLRQLWERRRHDRITWEAYNEVGGGRLAVQRTAESLFQQMNKSEQAIAKRTLFHLVTPGFGQRIATHVVERETLYRKGKPRDVVDRVIDCFVEARLLRSIQCGAPPVEQITVSHPALVGHWPRVVEWLAGQRDRLRRRLLLTDAAKTWRQRDRDPNLLWRGSVLREAERYDDLDPLETAFVQASRAAVEDAERREIAAAQRETRRARMLALALSVGVLLLAALVVMTFVWYRQANSARHEEHQHRVQLTVTQGTQLLESGDGPGAALWFAEALRLEEQDEQAEHHVKQLLRRRIGAELRQQAMLAHLWHPLPLDDTAPDSVEYQARTVEFSEDGTRAIVGGVDWNDGKARIFDAATGADLGFRLSHESGRVEAVAISPDNTMAATTGKPDKGDDNDGGPTATREFCLWKLTDDKATLTEKITGEKSRIVFSPNGKYVAVAAGNQIPEEVAAESDEKAPGEVRVWDLSQDPPTDIKFGASGYCRWVAFDRESNLLATAKIEEKSHLGIVEVWDFAKNPPERIASHEGLPRYLSRVAFSPDSRRVVIASNSEVQDDPGEAKIWNWAEDEDGKRSITLEHRSGVSSAEFSPNGELVVTTDIGGAATLWRSRDGRELAVFKHGSSVFDAQFSPDGRLLATASRDGTARVWEIATKFPKFPPLHHDGSVTRVKFAPDGHRLLTSSRHFVRVWNLATGNAPPTLLPSLGEVQQFACSPDGQYIVTVSSQIGYESAACQLWKYGEQIWSSDDVLPGDDLTANSAGTQRDERIQAASFSTDGRFMVTADSAGKLRFFSIQERAVTASDTDVIETGIHGIQCVALSSAADSDERSAPRFVAVSTGDLDRQAEKVAVWDLKDPRERISDLKTEHAERVISLAFNSTGDHLLTASADDTAKVWNIGSRKQIGEPLQHTANVVYAAFSPDGESKYVVTASLDRTAVIWDYEANETVAILPHNAYVSCARFSNDGQFLVTTSQDGSARVWFLNSDHQESTDDPRNSPMRPELLATLEQGGDVSYAAFDASDDYVTTAGYYLPVLTDVVRTGNTFSRRIVQRQRWNISPSIKKSDEADFYARLLGARRFNQDHQSLQRLEKHEIEEAWKNWNALDETNFMADSTWTRHDRAAVESEATQQWFAAGWHLDRLPAEMGDSPAWLVRRACACAELGQFDEVERVATQAAELHADDVNIYYWQALARLANARSTDNDLSQYHAACSELLDRYETTADRNAANRAVWACVLTECNPGEAKQCVDLATELVARTRDEPGRDPAMHRCLNTLGAALYRAKNYDVALERFEQSNDEYEDVQRREKVRSVDRYRGKAWNWIFLAMVHWKIHATATNAETYHADEARRFLSLVEDSLGMDGETLSEQNADALGVPTLSWDQTLSLRLLLEEARALIPDADSPSN